MKPEDLEIGNRYNWNICGKSKPRGFNEQLVYMGTDDTGRFYLFSNECDQKDIPVRPWCELYKDELYLIEVTK